ncbi:uncharacterized protein LOC130138175 isoform X2 [Syzygium oleosum]|uniref:uncharacterized protein LOC130138175 isoform X2 n=1 Tax=Syzygium oleosum TaxID=219896 RepID=UPI0024BAD410|nr:uncharacterized protein LOC130138175 isoform X2 [Syzygium oleosum]
MRHVSKVGPPVINFKILFPLLHYSPILHSLCSLSAENDAGSALSLSSTTPLRSLRSSGPSLFPTKTALHSALSHPMNLASSVACRRGIGGSDSPSNELKLNFRELRSHYYEGVFLFTPDHAAIATSAFAYAVAFAAPIRPLHRTSSSQIGNGMLVTWTMASRMVKKCTRIREGRCLSTIETRPTCGTTWRSLNESAPW